VGAPPLPVANLLRRAGRGGSRETKGSNVNDDENNTLGTWYTPGDKPTQEPDLYVNPPYAMACGTGAFLVQATDAMQKGGE